MALWTMTDNAAGKPKYLNSADKALTHGVDATEESVVANKAKGVQHPGWVRTITYTDSSGATRYKSETLVASGSMGGDTGAQNTQDDALLPDSDA
jgi:hypothetical protein